MQRFGPAAGTLPWLRRQATDPRRAQHRPVHLVIAEPANAIRA